ncbi:MAG: A/G-specific adenine glycosylase [Bacteroidetes bacterium]|nr:MAG: A/G-specific adenine glycosylase [Bacteroidota bacterium]
MPISKDIISWYLKNKRELPWRQTKNPYLIWVSEIMLQQTRVKQAMGYFYHFVARFPDLNTLANAEEKEVLKYWQGLGYYTRARNLHYSAQYIVNELNGLFPDKYSTIIKLKGVGEYTAAAIASFAFGEKIPAIDGNVFRVLSRIFNENLAINTGTGKRAFKKIAEALIENFKADEYNQAMMEFGAIICKPSNPLCSQCPVVVSCLAYHKGNISELPVKKKTGKLKKRYLNYLFIKCGKKTLIKERNQKDIWRGLYEFPLIETKSNIMTEELTLSEQWLDIVGDNFKLLKVFTPVLHRLSHQLLNITFYCVEINEFKIASLYEKVFLTDLISYPVPKVIENFINELDE